MNEDFSNIDLENSAWPVVIDEVKLRCLALSVREAELPRSLLSIAEPRCPRKVVSSDVCMLNDRMSLRRVKEEVQ